MNKKKLLERGLKFDHLTVEEGLYLFENAATSDLMFVANAAEKTTGTGQ